MSPSRVTIPAQSSHRWYADSRSTFRIGATLIPGSAKTILRQNQALCLFSVIPEPRLGLTPHSTRTLSALPTSTSLGLDFTSPLSILPPAGPVNFFR